MAEIGWIDFSQKDRNRVNSILDLLRPEGQVDELGIGVIRDALADELFPGMSTIQTRAKYFFIIPYILHDYLRLEISERRRKSPSVYLEEQENEIMWYLSEKYERKDGYGVIGISKRKEFREKLARRASEIYWRGLNKLKCIDSKGFSANSFLNRVNKHNLESHVLFKSEDEMGDDKDVNFENIFNILVEYNPDWKKDLDLNLTKSEAQFLKDSIIDLEGSLLSAIMKVPEITEIFMKADTFIDFGRIVAQKSINEKIKRDVILAHDFAYVIEGAHIAYNQELQMHFFGEDCFEKQWTKWWQSLKKNMINYEGFNPDNLFEYAKTTPPYTSTFIKDWTNLIRSRELDNATKRELIRNQEYCAKRKKARIKFNKKEDVKKGKRIGLSMLSFRYRDAKTIISDILNGLKNA